MKNACVVLKNESGTPQDRAYSTLLKGFASCGYAFGETRILSCPPNEKLVRTLNDLKAEYDTLLVLTEKNSLPSVKSLASGVFREDNFTGAENGGGIFAENEKTLFLLPADGEETLSYIKTVCVPYLSKKFGTRLDKLVVRAVGASESRVKSLIASARTLSKDKMRYCHTRLYDEDIVEIFYDQTAPKMLLDDVLRVFAEGFGDTMYALDDTALEEQLVRLLKIRGQKISVAESFTGGGIASKIVSVSGASEVYFEGLNTYNELSKVKRLGVSEYTLGTVGAVSDQTAYEMAAGLIATGNCDISIATTGLAGPKSDKSMLPVGLCYIAVGTRERVFVYRYKFDGSRETITKKAINYALFLAYKQLKNM